MSLAPDFERVVSRAVLICTATLPSAYRSNVLLPLSQQRAPVRPPRTPQHSLHSFIKNKHWARPRSRAQPLFYCGRLYKNVERHWGGRRGAFFSRRLRAISRPSGGRGRSPGGGGRGVWHCCSYPLSSHRPEDQTGAPAPFPHHPRPESLCTSHCTVQEALVALVAVRRVSPLPYSLLLSSG